MASTDKTPKLGLNQWAAGDDVLRADFNADNGKIDTAVEANKVAAAAAHALAAAQGGQIVCGTYTGSYVENQVTSISLGFHPQGVLVSEVGALTERGSGFAVRGHDVYTKKQWSLRITETGFDVTTRFIDMHLDFPCLGGAVLYHYVA
ncbi:MAG: hypothetical protein RRY64_10660, partial [Oscillospiraceae bacterium]